MNIYRNYTSKGSDPRHLATTDQAGQFKLRPLSGQFDIFGAQEPLTKQISHWQEIFPNAAFFAGHDDFFGPVVTMVYKNEATSKLSTMSITKFGCNVFENLILDSSSRFSPACDNLDPKHRDLNVRRALAITNLKNYNKLWKNKGQVPVTLEWDETNAGALASRMDVLVGRTPQQLGAQLLDMGILQDQTISSTVVDVVYNNRNPEGGQKIVNENNQLVMLLGDQMNYLFDPLLEYSPQTMDYEYKPPTNPQLPFLHASESVRAIVKELLDIQTHYTMDLVCILQDFIIPLRVGVLNASSTSTLGIAKVNVVFPPTIDEVTRVNCIAHDALVKAEKYGYVEVFNVLAIMLPFFYNAFVRHQANLSKFHSHYSKFIEHNRQYAIESKEINKGGYTVRGIESVIAGSIFELPRMKLIIKRLYDTINEEKGKDDAKDAEAEHLEHQFNTIMEIIDSFGYNETESEKTRQRVFTPSGKLLMELATGWPSELQYGWMDRKVVGIFQLSSTLNAAAEPQNEVLIIFSDHLLFIEIEEKTNQKAALLLPEVLMNSLINAKPLPRFSHFPNLKVKYWCDIDNLIVRSYEANESNFLSFTAYGKNYFRNREGLSILSVENYRVATAANGLATCEDIVDLVSKAQVLSKSVPFHLFKGNETHLRTYFCAHDNIDYESEVSKSPIVILLNMSKDDVKDVFTHSDGAFFVYNISLLNDHTLQLNGYSRHKPDQCEVDQFVSVDDFRGTLKESLYHSLEAMFRSTFLSSVLTAANLQFINCLLEERGETSKDVASHNGLSTISGKTKVSSDIAASLSINAYPETPKTTMELEFVPTAQKVVELKPTNKEKPSRKNLSRRKSFLLSVFGKLKKKNSDGDKATHGEDASTQKNQVPATQRIPSSEKKIPDTVIPKGKKLKYEKIYTPTPRLRDSSAVSSVVHNSAPANQTQMQDARVPVAVPVAVAVAAQNDPQSRVVSTNTATSSQYTDKSLEVNTHFEFPAGQDAASDLSHNHLTIYPREKSEVPRMFPELKSTNELDITSGIESNAEAQSNIKNGYHNFTKWLPELEAVSVARINSHESVATVKPAETVAMTEMIETTDAQNGVQPSWRAADGDLSVAEPSKLEKPKRKIFSSQDTAIALENINASGISPEIYDKYKRYDEVPVSTFYSDGEQNWVAYIRDNSSNLQDEIRAMKEEANMDTLDVIDVDHRLPMMPAVHQFDSSDGTFSTVEYGSFRQEKPPSRDVLNPTKASIPDYLWNVSREDSIQSFNAADFISDFGTSLEDDFAVDSEIGSRRIFSVESIPASRRIVSMDSTEQNEAVPSGTSGLEKTLSEPGDLQRDIQDTNAQKFSGEVPLIVLGTPNLSSSEDEYFSSNEFATALEHFTLKTEHPGEYTTMTSSSSDRTLMADFLGEPRDHDASLRLDSVGYLSDILNGTVKI